MTRILFPLLLACGTTTIDISKDCDVRLGEPTPNEAAVGAVVSASISPATTHWDTAVYVGGERAPVSEIVRVGCEACDTCKEDAGCLSCSDCDDCDAICEAECIETVVFSIPDLPPGATDVVLYNGHGGSNTQLLQVNPPSDTGAVDSGLTTDTGD
jgi:hypothetical protein